MGLAGIKRCNRVSGDRIIRSGKRLFASRSGEEVKRMRLTSESEIKLGESKKPNKIGTDEVMKIDLEEHKEIKVNGNTTDEQEGEINFGESKKTSLVGDNPDEGNKVVRTKKFGVVYTRKRKRTIPGDSSLNRSSLEEKSDSDKMYKNKYYKKRARSSLGLQSRILNSKLGFDWNDVLWKGPIIFIGPCSYTSSNSSSILGFSCFVSSVLRYMRKVNVFSWRQFSSFLLSDLTVSIYSSIGIRFSQESTCTTNHGFLKVFGSILSIPLFTMNFMSLPFYFLYIHSSLLLKSTFLSYTLLLHPITENITDVNIKLQSVVTRLHQFGHFGKFTVPTKARSTTKRVPRVSLFNKGQTHVDNIVPIPVVREVVEYEQESYQPFKMPELYISSGIDEVSRTLQKSYPIYDMDSVDEEWLNKFNNEHFGGNEIVSEDTFEKIIDAFERGSYCSPNDYSSATSAVDQCLGLASKEVLGAVYRYWMNKRKKRRSSLIRVFQCYPCRRVRKHVTKIVLRKKRSFRRRKSQWRAGKQVDFVKALMNERKSMEEAKKAYMKVQETQEDERRLEAAAIAKRQEAQALMEAADLAVYRATMALRIAESRAGTQMCDPVLLFGAADC